jgi:hypothetical protein
MKPRAPRSCVIPIYLDYNLPSRFANGQGAEDAENRHGRDPCNERPHHPKRSLLPPACRAGDGPPHGGQSASCDSPPRFRCGSRLWSGGRWRWPENRHGARDSVALGRTDRLRLADIIVIGAPTHDLNLDDRFQESCHIRGWIAALRQRKRAPLPAGGRGARCLRRVTERNGGKLREHEPKHCLGNDRKWRPPFRLVHDRTFSLDLV